MGVKGLSSFVDHNQRSLLSQHKLHDTKIIIDGNNFMHYLFNIHNVGFEFGGDYDQYAKKCKSFFNNLRKCNVRPYVVFDGGYHPDDRKLETVLKRRQARITNVFEENGSVLPILAIETLKQALDELDIPHVSCQFEADREIAVLAHIWACPVLSNDSDFLIYSLEGGVIPFDHINSGEILVLESDPSLTQEPFKYIPVKLYHYSRFAQKYPKYVANLVLPVFGSLLGNDYVDFKQLLPFYNVYMPILEEPKFEFVYKNDQRNNRMLHSLDWLERITTREHLFDGVLEYLPKGDRNEVKTKLNRSLDGYCNIDEFTSIDLEKFFNLFEMPKHERNLESFAFNWLLDYHIQPVPEWLVSAFRCCKIDLSIQNAIVLHRVIQYCQMELMGRPTAYKCSKRIRQITYGLFFPEKSPDDTNKEVSRGTHIVEYDRKDKGIIAFYVSPMWQNNWNIYTTPSISNQEARLQILLNAVKYKPRALFKKHTFSNSIIIVICMLCLWIKRADPKVSRSAMMSLLVTVLYLNVKTLNWYNNELEKRHDDAPPKPCILDDVEIAFDNSNDSQICEFMKHLETYTRKPEKKGKKSKDYCIVHGFSQFQAILIDTIQLNQLLACPLPLFSPGYIYSGTTVYNLCTDLDYWSKPDLFVAELMVHKSPIHQLFTNILQVVLEICPKALRETVTGDMSDQGHRSYLRAWSYGPGDTSAGVKVTNRYDALLNIES